jgi:hypothetical protein
MSLFTVTIGANSYEVYNDVAGATLYISAIFGPQPAAWLALSADSQAQTLVSATRYLDEQPWDGTRNGTGGTTLQWPRDNVTVDGAAVDPTTVPIEFPKAAAKLAVLIMSDPSLPDKIDQGSNIQAANAGGGTGVTFFSQTSARAGTATVMPVEIQRLLGKYLATAVANEGGFAGVGKSCSSFAAANQFTLVRGEE